MEGFSDHKALSQMEYSAQLFIFMPDAFVDTLTGVATNICEANLKSAQRHIQKCFDGQVTEAELDQCFTKITERYTEVTEKVFIKFGRFVKNNLLLIPEAVALPEDKIRPAETANADEADKLAAENKLARMRTALVHSKLKKAVLAAKVRRLQQIRDRQERLVRESRDVRDAARAVKVFAAEVTSVGEAKDLVEPFLEEACQRERESFGVKRPVQLEADEAIVAKKMKIA